MIREIDQLIIRSNNPFVEESAGKMFALFVDDLDGRRLENNFLSKLTEPCSKELPIRLLPDNEEILNPLAKLEAKLAKIESALSYQL